MKSGAISNRSSSGRAFTLAEVLAALLFMAIVIPVAVQALRVASLAGEVAERKQEAARVAERILNESIATTNWNSSGQSGTAYEGTREFRWTLRNDLWNQSQTNALPMASAAGGQLASAQPQVNALAANQLPLNLLSIEVLYSVQNQDYSVKLSTLVNTQ